jgi:hypothetical protein
MRLRPKHLIAVTTLPLALVGATALAVTSLSLGPVGATAPASPPSGETLAPLARGALLKPANANAKVTGGGVKIQTKGALDAFMAEITLEPGGTGGWHTHAGPVITVVKQGTMTIYDAKCKPHEIPTGSAEISPGTTATKNINQGTTPVVYDVTFLIPHGASIPRVDHPAPAGCNA